MHESGPMNDCNEGVLRISQSSSITGALLSDCLMSFQGQTLGESYPTAEMQSPYFIAPADWAKVVLSSLRITTTDLSVS